MLLVVTIFHFDSQLLDIIMVTYYWGGARRFCNVVITSIYLHFQYVYPSSNQTIFVTRLRGGGWWCCNPKVDFETKHPMNLALLSKDMY